MTLTNRLTLFFLAALAVVLTGFSAGLYLLVRDHLYREADSRAKGTIDSLVASVEDTPEGLEWEPEVRRTEALKRDSSLPWALYGPDGNWLDGSPSMRPMLSALLPPHDDERIEQEDISYKGKPWRLIRRTILPANFPMAGQECKGRHDRFAAFLFVTAEPLGPIHDDLRWLAATLAGLSLAAWTLTAILGRWFCRRALAPLTRMAGTVRLISSDRLDERLPDPKTNDELANLGTAFNDLLARLDDAFARQRRFTAEASHQLRTPLTGMLGQLEVALRRERSPEDYRRAMEAVQRQAMQMRELIEMLLFLARADADAKSPDTAVIELDVWLREFVKSWAGHERAADISLGTTNTGLRAKASSALLAQAVGNLLDNACRYSNPGMAIKLHLERREKEAVLTVEDMG
ncbi:histidine kinase dimerization/phospho-acceptor domain-containing protein, partial [Zavarzinella formosa]|uniref:histidine kinase dimerization/phospho-acceptor domain-containing protein n=1 Tax=Zavarzinella formosa TaxID=360055 RepID=UPI00187DC7B4